MHRKSPAAVVQEARQYFDLDPHEGPDVYVCQEFDPAAGGWGGGVLYRLTANEVKDLQRKGVTAIGVVFRESPTADFQLLEAG